MERLAPFKTFTILEGERTILEGARFRSNSCRMLRIIECTCIYIGLLQKVITGRTKSTVQVFLWWTVVVRVHNSESRAWGPVKIQPRSRSQSKRRHNMFTGESRPNQKTLRFRKWNRQDLSFGCSEVKKRKKRKRIHFSRFFLLFVDSSKIFFLRFN